MAHAKRVTHPWSTERRLAWVWKKNPAYTSGRGSRRRFDLEERLMSATSRYAKWEAAGGPRIIQKIDNGFTARKMLRLVRFARWHHPRHWAVPITGPKTMTPWYVPSRAESLSRHWIHWVTRLLWLFNHTLGPQQIKTLLAQARENMRPKNLCHIQTVRTPQVYPEGVSKPGDSPGDVPPPAAGWKGEWWEAPDAPGSKPAWAP